MGIVFVLLPASLLLAMVGVFAFIWAARNRQFDDVEVSAARLLFDPDEQPSAANERLGSAEEGKSE